MNKRSGWYERKEAHRINKDWVDVNCKLTDREMRLLEIVYYRKIVRRDHLEFIHEGYRDIPERTSVLNRSIRKLFGKMCLDKVHEESEHLKGNKPCILSVDRAGCILLDKPYKKRFETEKKFLNGKEYVFRKVPSHYNHIHGVNKLEIETIEFCIENSFKKIVWQLEEDNIKSFEFNKEKIVVKPDIFMILNVGKPLVCFIEYDTGSENRGYTNSFPTILEKLEKYQKYKMIGIWKSEWWAKKINTDFPLLIFVTEDDKRINYINQKGTALGVKVKAIMSNEYKKMVSSLI